MYLTRLFQPKPTAQQTILLYFTLRRCLQTLQLYAVVPTQTGDPVLIPHCRCPQLSSSHITSTITWRVIHPTSGILPWRPCRNWSSMLKSKPREEVLLMSLSTDLFISHHLHYYTPYKWHLTLRTLQTLELYAVVPTQRRGAALLPHVAVHRFVHLTSLARSLAEDITLCQQLDH